MVKVIRRSPPLIILLDVLFIFIFILAARKTVSFELDRLEDSTYNNYAEIIACSGQCSEDDQQKWTGSEWISKHKWSPNSIVFSCNEPECERPVSDIKFENYYAVINSCLSGQIQYLFYNLCSSRKRLKYCRPLSIPVNSEGNIVFSIFEKKYEDIIEDKEYKNYKNNIKLMQENSCKS